MSSDSGRPDCNFCGGGGLPILPVRYAVARSDAPSTGAPRLPEDLKDGAVSRITLPAGQHYTLRLLREGFLYLFNAARGRWQGYHVTREGFLGLYIDVTHRELLALDPDKPGALDAAINAPIEDDEFPCRANPEHVYPGRCVTIPAADEADDIYMTFSDDRWTKRVWKEYATNQNGRRDTMRHLSLPQWKSGRGRYAKPLTELGDCLAEAAFAWTIMQRPQRDDEAGETATTEVHALSHSPAPVNGMRNDIDGFLSWTARQAEPSGMTPALFVLDDAAGVTSDLASLLEVREEEFNKRESIHRPFVTAGVVHALRDGIQERARLQHVDDIVERRLRNEYYNSYGGPPGMEASMKTHFERRQRENAEFRQEVDDFRLGVIDGLGDEELEAKAGSAWRKYGEKLRAGEPDSWMSDTYRPALTNYDTETMRPLVEAYLAWLTGDALQTYLDSRFDNRDIESGIAFVSVVSYVLLGTQSYTPAFKQYVEWLSSEDIADANLLLRALCLNHEELREQVLAAAAAANDRQAERQKEAGDAFRTLSWGPLIASFAGLTADLPDEMVSPAWLVGRLLGPMMSAVNGEHLPRPLLVALGVTAGQPVRMFTQRGTTLKQAIPALSDLLKQLYPQLEAVDQWRFQRKLEVETRSLRRMSNAAAGRQDIVFAVRRLELGTLSDYGSETRLINQAMGALEPISDIGSRGGMGERLGTLVANREVSAGVLGAFFAICAFNSYLSNMDRLLDAPVRQQGRLMGAGLAAAGAGLELIAATLSQARRAFVTSSHLLVSAQHFTLRLGLRLGLAGGITLGVMDFWEGIEKFGDKQPVIGTLYITLGVTTIGASAAVFAVATVKAAGSAGLLAGLSTVALWWAAGVFGVIAIGAAIVIWWFTEDDLQEWLAQGAFGVRGELGLGTAVLASEMQRLEAITQEGN